MSFDQKGKFDFNLNVILEFFVQYRDVCGGRSSRICVTFQYQIRLTYRSIIPVSKVRLAQTAPVAWKHPEA